MRKMLRPAAAAMTTLSTIMLLGCAHNGEMANSPKEAFTVNTPLDVIAADPKGMAVLVKDVPGVMFSPKYPMIEDMSLAQVAVLAGGKIPAKKLDEVTADLNQLEAQDMAAEQAAAKQASAKQSTEDQAAAPPASGP